MKETYLNKKTRVGAYGVLVHEQKILLCRLSKIVHLTAGHWILPGGKIEFGEDPKSAVIREFREETGLETKVILLQEVQDQVYQIDNRKYHAIRIIYWLELIGGTLKNEIDGSTDMAQWFAKDELKELLKANEIQLVELAKLGVKIAFDI